MPTETVYGLAADATNAEAVARIYEAKGRPSFNPLIVHVPDLAAAERIGEFDDAARELAEAALAGPLTLVVPLREDAGIASIVTAGLPTIGLRVPAHPAMQALLRAVGRPLAAPSANASGSISPTRAEHVAEEPRRADSADHRRRPDRARPRIDHRRRDRRAAAAAPARPDRRSMPNRDIGEQIEAPGQLASHYAPSKPLRLDAVDAAADEYLIGFGAVAGDASLSPSGDLVEAAARLFDLLHQADASAKPRIAVAPVPDEGLGAAINDRLRRAAAALGRRGWRSSLAPGSSCAVSAAWAG